MTSMMSSRTTNGAICHGRGRMIVVFTTTYAASAYHHSHCEFESRSVGGVLDTTYYVIKFVSGLR